MHKNLLIGLLLILVSNSAEIFSSGTYPPQGVHVHGEAVLDIVLDGNALSIELDSPAINLIGFEHTPNNDEQAAALAYAKQTLASAHHLFHFFTTTCQLENVEIDVPNLEKDEHKLHHEAHHDHADFHASYVFQCEQAKDLTVISIKLFSLFPAIQEIKVHWIFQGKQNSASLTADNPTLRVN